jgi:alpha-L-fucosidase
MELQMRLFRLLLLIIVTGIIGICGSAIGEELKRPTVKLARPSDAQYEYQELERIMFIHFHPGTWHGVEYDNGKTDLNEINPAKLDTDQWCRVAKSWDAKMILYVAKHCGGFCWWQTDTTEYSIKNTPYKNGKGDVLKEITDSCKKYGLKFGVYVYPGDPAWGAGVGSGGRTRDPSKQEAYNRILRQQLTETWTRYGNIDEAWFDGSCSIPIADLVEKYLGDAVILQSPQANIRWVGNEAGIAPYPAWNSLKSKDLKTGLTTAAHGDPDGDAWAPLECDVPLYNHKWLWSKQNERLRRSVNELVNIYYKSVGRGAVLLMNATPNTDGLIPVGDIKRYEEFGDELDRRFSDPLGVTEGKGKMFTIKFDKPTKVNQFMIMEDYRCGERIRGYVVEVRTAEGRWKTINTGLSVGRKRIVMFDPVAAGQVTLRITDNVNVPIVRAFKVYFVEGDNGFLYEDMLREDEVSRNAKATASDEHSAPYLAGKICDGNTSSRWATGSKCGTPEAMKAPYTSWVELDLGEEKTINSTAIIAGWDRIRDFKIEYRNSKDQDWKIATTGTTVGSRFKKQVEEASGRYWRLNILEATDSPTIWEWQLFGPVKSSGWQKCTTVEGMAFKDGIAEIELDLKPFITIPGQYLVRLDDLGESDCRVERTRLLYNGREVLESMLSPIKEGELYNINRTAVVVDKSRITLKIRLKTEKVKQAKMEISIKREM